MKKPHSKSYMIPQLHDLLRSCDTLNAYIPICTRPIVTKYQNVVTHHEGFHPYIHISLYTCVKVGSRDKLKTKQSLCKKNIYKTYQGGDIPWGTPTHKLPSPHGPVTHEYQIRQGNDLPWKYPNLPPLKPHGSLITWPTWGSQHLYFYFHKIYGY